MVIVVFGSAIEDRLSHVAAADVLASPGVTAATPKVSRRCRTFMARIIIPATFLELV